MVLCITGVSHHLPAISRYLKASAWCHCMLAGINGQCVAQLVAGTDPCQVPCSPHVSPQSHTGLMAHKSNAEVPPASSWRQRRLSCLHVP